MVLSQITFLLQLNRSKYWVSPSNLENNKMWNVVRMFLLPLDATRCTSWTCQVFQWPLNTDANPPALLANT